MVVILSFAMIEQAYSFSANTSKRIPSLSANSIQVLLQSLFDNDFTKASEATPKSNPLSESFPEQQDGESEEEGCEEDDLKLLFAVSKTSYTLSIVLKKYDDHDLASLGFMLGKIPTPPPEV
ncbi:hypothetical protein [Reichenbachiella sp. MALMAid0571]|uniref:hypothetical protein n=1 Tax=Reichenbachiella sp. MALMAid0571 TaxID=3143939 RepID=UPI0032E006E5